MSAQIMTQLGTIARDLDAAVRRLGDLEQAAVEAKNLYKVEYAKAYLVADGAVAMREAHAVVATGGLQKASDGAEALVRVQREHIRALHARLDVGRTIATTERALSGVTT